MWHPSFSLLTTLDLWLADALTESRGMRKSQLQLPDGRRSQELGDSVSVLFLDE
jgi:hypothetical protein